MGVLEVYAAIVKEDREIFLIAGPDGSRLPGGTCPTSEAIEACLMRLVKEQTGLDVSVDVLTGLYQRPQDGRLALVFRCHPLQVGSDEGQGVWEKPLGRPGSLAPTMALRINDCLRYDGRAALRLQ